MYKVKYTIFRSNNHWPLDKKQLLTAQHWVVREGWQNEMMNVCADKSAQTFQSVCHVSTFTVYVRSAWLRVHFWCTWECCGPCFVVWNDVFDAQTKACGKVYALLWWCTLCVHVVMWVCSWCYRECCGICDVVWNVYMVCVVSLVVCRWVSYVCCWVPCRYFVLAKLTP